MSYTNGLDKPSDYFNTITYVANQTDDRQITVGFQPDFTWLKDRDQAVNYDLYDAVRGATKSLSTNNTNAEATQTDGLKSFNSTGFTLGTGWGNQTTGDDYVAWNWLASNSTASNTDGTITSTVSTNQTSGFSIVSYTGTGSNATVGHGLSAVPSVIIIKDRDNGTGYNWRVYHHKNTSAPETDVLVLNLTNATNDNVTYWNDTAPTSSVFTIGTDLSLNNSGDAHIAYCFAEKKGYSKFGSYTGNSNADGTFVYTGFKPAFFMVKATNAAENWLMVDNKRTNSFNPVDGRLIPNSSGAEETNVTPCDFLSNGVKFRFSDGAWNNSSNTYIYMAFAENPFVTSTGIPCTAR